MPPSSGATVNRISSSLRYFIVTLLGVIAFKSFASLVSVYKLFISGQAASAPSGALGLTILAADELINLAWHASLVFLLVCRHDRLSENWIADASFLAVGVDTPIYNLIAALTFPGFLQQKNYAVFYTFHSAIVGFALPPAHMLAYWVFAGPMYM